MGRAPCCEKDGLKKGPWTPEEDQKLIQYIEKHGHGSWRTLPKNAGLARCGKSCRLRWTNYLRPDIKRGKFTPQEDHTIIHFHSILGNKWSAIATHLPGRTDNEIKNYWNTHLRKRLLRDGIDPITHLPRFDIGTLLSLLHSNSFSLCNPKPNLHFTSLNPQFPTATNNDIHINNYSLTPPPSSDFNSQTTPDPQYTLDCSQTMLHPSSMLLPDTHFSATINVPENPFPEMNNGNGRAIAEEDSHYWSNLLKFATEISSNLNLQP
ncbi:hypothetical protein AMTRI_Chr09g12620 [Amborella trichopoda]